MLGLQVTQDLLAFDSDVVHLARSRGSGSLRRSGNPAQPRQLRDRFDNVA
jgi:hypothetical protein